MIKDYPERVYAGVLGKTIGVYLGRPFEGWSHERIVRELGEIRYYVNDKLNQPLVVTDDDLTGTFTFIRALSDYGYDPHVSAEQIGQTWLNYIIENRTILWWGGMGMSTEHTAYLRLKSGIKAPQTGSRASNGKVVAEQIGSQIFIDSWAMVSPGNPQLAVDLARKAASVSHDGEAIHGAVVLAAMESLAFIEPDLNRLLDSAIAFIPRNCSIFRVIGDLRECRAKYSDWHSGLELIQRKYGYDKFGGGCHMVPNHAVVMLGLLWGNDSFEQSLMIANTAGYDTDCNSGNVGCLLGIKNGLPGIDTGPDWRGPIADRLLLPTADSGGGITDTLTEAFKLIKIGTTLAGESYDPPKNGARFHFSLPGSVQGFAPIVSSDSCNEVVVTNELHPSGQPCLSIRYNDLKPGNFARVTTPTFGTPDQFKAGGYALLASPTLYPGQIVRATIIADPQNAGPVQCSLFLRHYNAKDELEPMPGEICRLTPGESRELSWRVPEVHPIADVGLQLTSDQQCSGRIDLDRLTWDGTPSFTIAPASNQNPMQLNAWVNGMQQRVPWMPGTFVQNTGRGLLILGSRDWTHYRVETTLAPHMVRTVGLAARVQGMGRYYALLINRDQTARLVKVLDAETVLAEVPYPWEFGQSVRLAIEVKDNRIAGLVDGQCLFNVTDPTASLTTGGIAIICEEGRGAHGPVTVSPASQGLPGQSASE